MALMWFASDGGLAALAPACTSRDYESLLRQETWLLSEFCDKGNLDRALSGGRFHDKASGKPEMVCSQSQLSFTPHMHIW